MVLVSHSQVGRDVGMGGCERVPQRCTVRGVVVRPPGTRYLVRVHRSELTSNKQGETFHSWALKEYQIVKRRRVDTTMSERPLQSEVSGEVVSSSFL